MPNRSSELVGALRRWRERGLRAWLSRRGAHRTVNGVVLRVDPSSRHTFTPVYDAGATGYLRSHVREGMEVWNVGANVGVYALQFAHWVGGTGRVVAFEPNPAARALLIRNVTLNRLDGRVEIVSSAVGVEEGTVDFFTSGADGMGRAGRPNPLLAHPDRMQVPVTTLDAVAALRARKPDVVMMDIEGWEIAALQGAASLLGSSRFVVELHPDAWRWSNHTREDLDAVLRGAQLEAIPLSGQSDPYCEHGQVALVPRPRAGRPAAG